MTLVLDRIAMGVADFSVLCEALITTPNPTMGKIGRKIRKIQRTDAATAITREKRAVFSVYLSRLKRDGLVTKEDSGWRILPKGLERLRAIRERLLPSLHYAPEKNTNEIITATIITFDVPEKERRKRDWLRCALRNLGCTMLHKSVWTVTGGLPRTFIDDLGHLGMTNYVHILSISKHGTLHVLLGT